MMTLTVGGLVRAGPNGERSTGAVRPILLAWVVTLPGAALLGFVAYSPAEWGLR